MVGLADPSFQVKHPKEIKFVSDTTPQRSNLDKMDKRKQIKTVTYKRIQEITNKIDGNNLNNPRFDPHYQNNMLEIDNRLQEPTS